MIPDKKMLVVDKVLKFLLCIMIIFVFTLVKPKQDVEAAVPILGWVAGVLGGLVIDVAIDSGVTFVNKQAEKDFKNKVVEKIWNSYSAELVKLKPTKLNALKWAFKAPKWLMLVVVDAVSDVVQEFKQKAINNNKYMSEWGGGSSAGGGAGRKFGPSAELPGEEIKMMEPTDPYYKTDLYVGILTPETGWAPAVVESYNYFMKYGKIIVTPVPYMQENKVQFCVASDCTTRSITKPNLFVMMNAYKQILFYESTTRVNSIGHMGVVRSDGFNSMYGPWEAYKQVLAEKGKTILEFGGVLTHDLPRVTLDLPEFMEPEKLQLLPIPNQKYDDRVIEFAIPEVLKPQLDLIPVEKEFEWEVVNNYIVDQGDNFYTVNYVIDYKPVINNYYELPPAVIEDIEGELIPVDKEEGPKELGNITGFIKNFYNYFADGLETSIDGFKQLNASVNNIFSVFGNYFTFLPVEFRTLMMSGAGMSVLLGVLYWGRRY